MKSADWWRAREDLLDDLIRLANKAHAHVWVALFQEMQAVDRLQRLIDEKAAKKSKKA